MASAIYQAPSSSHSTTFEPISTPTQQQQSQGGGVEKHHAQTTLNYYLETGKPPQPTIVGRPETFDIPANVVNVTVNDIAGEVENYSLDVNGFQILNHKSAETEFADDDQIKAQYWPEVEQLLKDVTGASRVVVFDHTIRRSNDTRDAKVARGPVNRVHIDQSYEAARARVAHHLPEEAEQLLKTRQQIINVWRPIKPIFKDPLAVADASSVEDEDLIPVPMIYPDRTGHTLSVRAQPQHRWHYLYGQTPEQVTFIKCYDSKTDGRARRVAHTAFVNPATVNEAPRESIEVRALVFHEDQTAE